MFLETSGQTLTTIHPSQHAKHTDNLEEKLKNFILRHYFSAKYKIEEKSVIFLLDMHTMYRTTTLCEK
jgi:hypothetical protein